MKLLSAAHLDRCIGCHSCSLACARLVHKQFSWNTAGIRIKSAGGLSRGFEASICLGCDPAACASACPTDALSQRSGGGIKFKRDLCLQCGKCAKACPVEAIYLDSEHNPYVCVHCGRCISFCPHNCLELREVPDREPDRADDTSAHSTDSLSLPTSSADTEPPHAH